MHYVDVLKQELVNTQAYVSTSSSENSIVPDHVDKCEKLGANVKITQHKLPTMYWIPKLHKTPFKARFIANSSSCTTTNLSKLLTSCFIHIKEHVQRYCDTTYNNSGIHLFWSIKNSSDVLTKILNKQSQVSTISTYDFSTLYTTLPHDLIKLKLIDLIKKTFSREQKSFLACNADRAFFTNDRINHFTMWTCSEVCESLTFLLDNIFVRHGDVIYRQVIGIPMGINCAPLVADLFLYCYERDFMLSLDREKQANVISAFNDTSRYLDDIFNMDNPYFDNIFPSIYPIELKLNKTNNSDTSAPFLDLDLSITNGIVSSKIYDKRDDFNFSIVNYPHLDGDVPHSTSYGVYISQLIRFGRSCSSVEDFSERNRVITEKLLRQGYRYDKLRKTFSKFYYRNTSLISKYNCNLKSLLRQGISHPDFYGDVIYKLRKIIGKPQKLFDELFPRRITKFIKRGYDRKILQHTARMLVDHSTMNQHAGLFDCATTGRA